MNLCDDGHSMTSEQRKVLNFYNEGSDQELATIQVSNSDVAHIHFHLRDTRYAGVLEKEGGEHQRAPPFHWMGRPGAKDAVIQEPYHRHAQRDDEASSHARYGFEADGQGTSE